MPKGIKGFQPGISGNEKGRRAGVPNKINKELRNRIKMFLDNNFDKIQADFKTLDPEKRIALYEKLLNYVISKRTDITSGDEKININLPDVIVKTNGN